MGITYYYYRPVSLVLLRPPLQELYTVTSYLGAKNTTVQNAINAFIHYFSLKHFSLNKNQTFFSKEKSYFIREKIFFFGEKSFQLRET